MAFRLGQPAHAKVATMVPCRCAVQPHVSTNTTTNKPRKMLPPQPACTVPFRRSAPRHAPPLQPPRNHDGTWLRVPGLRRPAAYLVRTAKNRHGCPGHADQQAGKMQPDSYPHTPVLSDPGDTCALAHSHNGYDSGRGGGQRSWDQGGSVEARKQVNTCAAGVMRINLCAGRALATLLLLGNRCIPHGEVVLVPAIHGVRVSRARGRGGGGGRLGGWRAIRIRWLWV